jgi:hypothetical protein
MQTKTYPLAQTDYRSNQNIANAKIRRKCKQKPNRKHKQIIYRIKISKMQKVSENGNKNLTISTSRL